MNDDLRARRPRSRGAAARLAHLVPGGVDVFATGRDQHPEDPTPEFTRRQGARVWDVDGIDHVEYGGLRSVALGNGHPRVFPAARPVHPAIHARA